MYNSRRKDVEISRRMETTLESIYRQLGWSVKRVSREMDIRGVDAIITIPGVGEILADEKVAAKYWDCELRTYCCELTCDTNKLGAGWFAPEQNSFYQTTHYIFVWVRAEEAELRHITRLEIAVVDKKALQMMLRQLIHNDALLGNTRALCDKVLHGRSRAQLAPGVKMIKNQWGPEYSTNVIFDRTILKAMAIYSRVFEMV